MNRLRLAFSFLTILPAALREAPQPGDMGRSAVWFPWIGLLIGGLVGLVKFSADLIFPPIISAGLSVAFWAFLTGGLHLDGLADCCDGMLNASSPERRLEIMRDPRLGSFGGTGLILHLLLKTLALASLPAFPAGWAFLLAPVLGRWLILLAARQPLARPGGMGADFALGLSRRTFTLAAVLPICLTILGGWRAVLAAALAHLTALGIFSSARSRLGGVTGDVFGLTVEASELVILLTFAARLTFPF